MPITVILHNIRSALNVGSILRTADGFGVESAIFSGYTPRIDDARVLPHLRDKLNHQIHKTALGAETYLPLTVSDDLPQTLTSLRADHYQILGLENNLSDPRKLTLDFANLSQIRSALKISPASPQPHLALLLGEEVAGIDRSLYPELDFFLEIPMRGQKESFNVSVATGVALFYLSNL